MSRNRPYGAIDMSRWCLIVILPVLAVTIAAQDMSTISPTHNSVTITYGVDGLPYETDCTVTLKNSGGTPIDSSTSTEGPSRRTVSFTGLTAATVYKLSVGCGGAFDWVSDVPFTTMADPGGAAVSVSIQRGNPVVLASLARATVQYDDNPTLATPASVQNTSCGTGCSIALGIARGLWWYRWIWQTAADATLATSDIQPLIVGSSTHQVLVPGTQTLAILDSWEKVEYADVNDFKTAASVKLSKNEPVGYVIRLKNDTAMPTGTFTTLYKMILLEITVPSYSGGQTGIFYDALVPLLSGNLDGTTYIYAEYVAPGTAGPQTVTLSQSGEAVTLNVTVVNNTLTPNAKPFYIAAHNSTLALGHYGHYVNQSEALGVPYAQILSQHRVAPYSTNATNPPIDGSRLDYDYFSGNGFSFRQTVLNFLPNKFMMAPTTGSNVTQAFLEAAEVSVGLDSQTGVWFYTYDEPSGGGITTANTRITEQNTYAPSIKTMVTTWIGSGVVNNDVYCPIIDWFENGGVEAHDTEEADYTGKELWLYTSCQEHNCSTNRNGNPGATKVSGGAPSGMPGLVIDHTAAHVYTFIAMPLKYTSVQALLYYNAVENYLLYADYNGNVDIWADTFNFGGNGDGTLLYPLRNGMYGNVGEDPAPSIRLKNIRSAEYMMDYAEAAGGAAVTSCGIGSLITDTNTWEHDADIWRTFRSCLITALGF